MPGVIYFEICVDDVDTAAKFYEKVFDWKIANSDDPSYRFIDAGDQEFSGAIRSRDEEWPTDGSKLDSTINTIDVPSVDSVANKIVAAGGKIVGPKIALEGVGYVQYCRDTDGNCFAIMEYDELAS
jgi:uncharacterized protein